MITVNRSDTGSYVLVHEPSQTIMVGDDLEATFGRMEEHLRAAPLLAGAMALAPSAPPPARSTAWLVGVAVLALLPFLWLGTLHYTLGRLVDQLRATPAAASPSADLQALRMDLEGLEQVVSRLEDEVGRSRHRNGRPRAKDASAADDPADPQPNQENADPTEADAP